MVVGEKIKEKEFKATTAKEAYLKCCKWVSTNILAANNSENIAYRIYKTPKVATVKLEVYIIVSEDKIQDQHCKICREVSSNLYLQSNKNQCCSCNLPAYLRRAQLKLDAVKDGIKRRVKI